MGKQIKLRLIYAVLSHLKVSTPKFCEIFNQKILTVYTQGLNSSRKLLHWKLIDMNISSMIIVKLVRPLMHSTQALICKCLVEFRWIYNQIEVLVLFTNFSLVINLFYFHHTYIYIYIWKLLCQVDYCLPTCSLTSWPASLDL